MTVCAAASVHQLATTKASSVKRNMLLGGRMGGGGPALSNPKFPFL
jgi:hypothetical protein